jgi:hypothetical protein
MTHLYDGTDGKLPAPIDRHKATDDLEMTWGYKDDGTPVRMGLPVPRRRPPLTGYRVIIGVIILALMAGFVCYQVGHVRGRQEQQVRSQVTITALENSAEIASDSADYWRGAAIDASATAEALESDLASVTAEWQQQAEEASATIGVLQQKRTAPKPKTPHLATASYSPGVEQWRGSVARWVAYYGGTADNVEQFLRVMTGESHGNPNATNGQHFGLMQIASIVHAAKIAEKAAEWGMAPNLYDPEFNIRFAAYMSAGGTNWGGWSVKP